MLEVEAKAGVPDLPALRRRLQALGAERVGAEEQRDTYLAHPQRDFASSDEALRLRLAGGRAELTYKGPKTDPRTKTREELTLRVDDAAAARRLLERLGFRAVATVAKRRETWRWRGAEVALDEVEGLGAFVEVELAASDAAQADGLGDRVLALLAELGAGPGIRTSYLELLLARRPEP